jgi:hypothetical protein
MFHYIQAFSIKILVLVSLDYFDTIVSVGILFGDEKMWHNFYL